MRRPNAWLHALGYIGIMNMVHAVMMYQTFYYVDTLGMVAASFALAKTVKAVWDAFNDPLLGYLSDRTRTRFGRRRPWLMFTLPLYALSFVALFWVPPGLREGTSLFWYMLVVVLIFETCDTIMLTNYNALFPELFRSVEERARAATIKNIFHMIAMVLGFALPPLLTQLIGYTGMAIMFSAMALILIPLTLYGSPEDPAASEAEPLGFKSAVKETARDRAFWVFTGVQIFYTMGGTLLMSGASFYAKYALKLDMMGTMTIFGGMYLVMMPMMHVWGKAARNMGLKRAWVFTIALNAAATLVTVFASGIVGGVLVGVTMGIGWSGVMITTDLVLAHLVDRDALRTGRRREGVYYSLNKFYTKLGTAANGYVFVLVGALFGYHGAADTGPNPEMAMRFLMSAVPCAAMVIAAVLARFFPYAEQAVDAAWAQAAD